MNVKQPYSNNLTPRENILVSLLAKLANEYKSLLEYIRRDKPFKIIEIKNLTVIPGETKFTIQIAHKNCIVNLSAAEIIQENYNLKNFSDYHAELIRKAAQGKLTDFLKITKNEPEYRVVSKKFDAKKQQYIFIIETNEKVRFIRTAEELSKNEDLLSGICIKDIYDIGYTQGTESVFKEKIASRKS
ncbi:MAG TPA: hypothetical protein VHZ76_10280 [Gammaproteobacteria bacterium]|jgi:hypothetical protein|nr:hypothetical protein [Gammaproteobacteria bacterium]